MKSALGAGTRMSWLLRAGPVVAALLCILMTGTAQGQLPCANPKTYTWTLVESPSVALRWPNQASSPNVFDADEVLLGRIIAETSSAITNACELAPSSPCASGMPPVFLLYGGTEGPSNSGGAVECNRKTIACNTAVVPGAGHGGHPAGNQDGTGEYSYLVIHTPALGSSAAGKGIAFLSGSFVLAECPYRCNDCPPLGPGRDESATDALRNTTASAEVQLVSVSLWTTQALAPFGHSLLSLATGGAGPGVTSVCGNGVAYQDLKWDICVNGLQPGTGDFTLADQKLVFRTYSVNMYQMSSAASPGRCSAPGCYIQNLIIPAALTTNADAHTVQMLTATSILPYTAPGELANALMDAVIFAYTTQLIDFDDDGVEDRIDPCPNDPTDSCIQNLLGAGYCPTGQVFCADANGDLGCLDAFLCNQRGDLNNDCLSDATDSNLLAGVQNGVQGYEVYNTGIPIGPFDP